MAAANRNDTENTWNAGDTGQGTLEYTGLVVLVAGIVVALPMAGVGDELARRFRCAAIAVVAAGKSCAANDTANGTAKQMAARRASPEPVRDGGGASPHPSGGPSDGPGFSRGNIPILPFPGAVSVTSRVGDYVNAPPNLPAKSGIVTTSTTVLKRRPPKLVRQQVKIPWTQQQRQLQRQLVRPPGSGAFRDTRTRLQDMVTLKLSTELTSTSRVEMEGGKLSVAQEAGYGTRRTYQTTVSQQHAEAIENGNKPAPNPRDPRTIPTGSSVLMSQSYFEQQHSEAQLDVLRSWALGMESTNERGHKVSSMVQRVDADEVRIVVGDSSYVQNIFKAGASYSLSGPEDRNSVSFGVGASSTDTVSSGKARQIVLEIDTEKGWKKYQQFVETGKLPDVSGKKPPYVTSSARVETVKTSSKASLEAEIEAEFNQQLTENFTLRLSHGRSYSLPLGSSTASKKTIQHNADGTVEITTQRRNGKITWQAKQTTNKNGKVTDTNYRMLLDDVNARWASQYRTLNSGKTKNYQKNQDIALRFDGKNLDSVQRNVYKYLAERCRSGRCHMQDPPKKASEVRDMLRGKESADTENALLYPRTNSVMLSDIARADNRKEIVEALSGHRGLSNNQTLKITRLARQLCEGASGSDQRQLCKPGEVTEHVPGEVEVVRSDS